jgi:broad specificity phosphatase PhoE
MTEVVYETHSTSLDNELGLATGWNQGELSERGLEQAREMGTRHVARSIDIVYASDLKRAVQTADIAFGERGIEIRHDARLRECNYGAWNGAPVEKIHADRIRYLDEPHPGGESYRDVVDRMREFLHEVGAEKAGSVVLIAHRAPWYAMEHLLNGVALEKVIPGDFEWQPGWRYVLNG